ncbi:MAG: polyphenol oxidase family protein [Saprospiraceae bacterium]|nr:polyphenol oxidase family protein [Saprospiraceae bacterium]
MAVSTADCVPILIYDPVNEACAAIHAGWKGTVLSIVSKTVELMQHRYGSASTDVRAYIGACIDQCHFEVGPEVLEQFDMNYIDKIDSASGKGFVDLKAANKAQLLTAGLTPFNIETSQSCTYDDAHRFFSHRRDKGKTGRMWSVIGLIK